MNARLAAGPVAILAFAAACCTAMATARRMAPGGATGLALAAPSPRCSAGFAIVAAEVTTLQAGWARIAVRAAGSWLAAASILMLGWLVSGLSRSREQ